MPSSSASSGETSAFDLIVVAASHGGPSALATFVRGFRADFPIPILIVCHIGSGSKLPERLTPFSHLTLKNAEDGERFRAGVAYFAPPGRHLTVTRDGLCEVTVQPRVNFCRPSADVLFKSAAAFGSRVLAVVLTGFGRDGAAGSGEIQSAGGLVFVQSPGSCQAPEMPTATIRNRAAHFAAAPSELVKAIVRLATVPGERDRVYPMTA